MWAGMKKDSYVQLVLLTLGITLICFGIYCYPHYSYDAYMALLPSEFNLYQSLQLGRPFLSLTSFVLSAFHVNCVRAQGLFVWTVLLSIVFAICLNYRLVLKYAGNISRWKKWILYIFCLVSYINVFIDEWFHFSEAYFMFGFALFFCCAGILFCTKERYLSAFLLLFVALGYYQAVLGLFLNWTIGIFIVKYKENLSCMMKNISLCIVTAGTASLANIFLTKVFVFWGWANTNPRQASLSLHVILENIKKIILGQRLFLVDGYHLLPAHLLWICLIILAVLLFASNWKRAFLNAALIAVLYTSPFLPFVVSSEMWMSQRTVISYFSIFSVIAIAAICTSNQLARGTRDIWISGLAAIVGLVLLFTNISAVQKLAVDQMSINKMDLLMCKTIEQKIITYEQETGNYVDTVAVARDQYPVYSYPGVTTPVYDTNLSALKVDWCLRGLFRYTMERDFLITTMDEEIFQKWFADKDWNMPDFNEQIKFQAHTMYLVLW